MYDHVHEKIKVVVEFVPGHKPMVQSFEWQQREHVVNELTLIVKARHGREVVWMLHVATDTGAYKLRFNTDELQWYLEEMMWEEPAARN